MKIRNKKTGEILDTRINTLLVNSDGRRFIVLDKAYDSISQLNEEWEDYEEPKKGFKKFIKLKRGFCVVFYDEETAEKEFEKAMTLRKLEEWKNENNN